MDVKILKDESIRWWYQIARENGKWRLDWCGEITYHRSLRKTLAILASKVMEEAQTEAEGIINEFDKKRYTDIFIAPSAVLS